MLQRSCTRSAFGLVDSQGERAWTDLWRQWGDRSLRPLLVCRDRFLSRVWLLSLALVPTSWLGRKVFRTWSVGKSDERSRGLGLGRDGMSVLWEGFRVCLRVVRWRISDRNGVFGGRSPGRVQRRRQWGVGVLVGERVRLRMSKKSKPKFQWTVVWKR